MVATIRDRLHLHFSHGLQLALDEFCRAECEGGKECSKETCWCIIQGTQVFCFLKISNYSNYHNLQAPYLIRSEFQFKYSSVYSLPKMPDVSQVSLLMTTHSKTYFFSKRCHPTATKSSQVIEQAWRNQNILLILKLHFTQVFPPLLKLLVLNLSSHDSWACRFQLAFNYRASLNT